MYYYESGLGEHQPSPANRVLPEMNPFRKYFDLIF